jgi:REP element-mobilizing transposase RayT
LIHYSCICTNAYDKTVGRRRIIKTGATYFVSSEINRGETAFDHSDLQSLLDAVITEAHTRYKFELWDMQIKGNFFNCRIKPAFGQNLSRIMQWVKSVVARRWNKVHEMHGHLWGERFSSEIIEEEKLVVEVVGGGVSGLTQRKPDPVPAPVFWHPRK